MKKYVIFDFDGTIINTNDVIFASWDATFNHYLGHTLPREEIYSTFGETLEYTIGQRIPNADVREALEYYKTFQEEHCQELVTLFDGTREMLDELHKRGYKMAIATSRLAGSFAGYMTDFDLWGYFDAYLCKEDVSHHKPHPESCLVALERLGAKPEEAVMLGDTRFDIGCANNAGVDSVLIGWNPMVDPEAIEAQGFKPKYYIKNMDELLEILENN